MTKRSTYLHSTFQLIAILVIACGLVAAITHFLSRKDTVFRHGSEGWLLYIYVETTLVDGSHYYYRAHNRDAVIGPYYIAPAGGPRPQLAAFVLDPSVCYIYNSHNPDDVYVYIDTKNSIFWPAPDCSKSVQEINDEIRRTFRSSASVTRIVHR